MRDLDADVYRLQIASDDLRIELDGLKTGLDALRTELGSLQTPLCPVKTPSQSVRGSQLAPPGYRTTVSPTVARALLAAVAVTT